MKRTLNSASFGVFEFDFETHELRKRGLKVHLAEQPARILALLLDQPSALITREELRNQLWHDDTFVDFDHSLNTAIMRLRRALGDSPENPLFIETLNRRGYRFIPPVKKRIVVAEADQASPADNGAQLATIAGGTDSNYGQGGMQLASVAPAGIRWAVLLGLLALILVAISIMLFGHVAHGARKPVTNLAGARSLQALSVTPPGNVSGDKGQNVPVSLSEYQNGPLLCQIGSKLGIVSVSHGPRMDVSRWVMS